MKIVASFVGAALIGVASMSFSEAAMTDAVDRVIAIDNNAQVWAEHHAPTEFQANLVLRECAMNRGDYVDCKALGGRIELLATKAIGVERLALEMLGDIVLKNAAGMEMQAEPDGLTDGAISAIVTANETAQKRRLQKMARDAKGVDVEPVVKYLEAFPPGALPG